MESYRPMLMYWKPSDFIFEGWKIFRPSNTKGVFILVLISSMSVWELGMLVEKKRIKIDMDVLDWVEQALDTPGMQLCPITPRIAIQSTRLVGEVHGDPIDRLLMATASEENAILVTCDKKMLKYATGKFISAHNPCKK